MSGLKLHPGYCIHRHNYSLMGVDGCNNASPGFQAVFKCEYNLKPLADFQQLLVPGYLAEIRQLTSAMTTEEATTGTGSYVLPFIQATKLLEAFCSYVAANDFNYKDLIQNIKSVSVFLRHFLLVPEENIRSLVSNNNYVVCASGRRLQTLQKKLLLEFDALVGQLSDPANRIVLN